MGKAQSSKKTEKAANMPEVQESPIIHWYPVTEDVTLNATEVRELEKRLTEIEGLLGFLEYTDINSLTAQCDVAISETVAQIFQIIRKASR